MANLDIVILNLIQNLFRSEISTIDGKISSDWIIG